METEELSRRSLLQAIAATMAPPPCLRLGGDRAGRAGGARRRRHRQARPGCRFSARPKRRTSKPLPRRSFPPTTRPAHARRASCTSSTGRWRSFLSQLAADYRAQLAGLPGDVSRTASGRRLVRGAHVRAADRVSQDGRRHAVLRHHAAAHAPRHVFHARATAGIATASAGS